MKPPAVRANTISNKWPILCILSAALVCNIFVLFVPFISVRIGLGREPYTLFHTVSLLWQKDMKLLTILVVSFSVVFPFLKLAVLCAALLVRYPGDNLWLALRFVCKYGKWSLLDVFLVCLILVLASGQIFIAATPDLGIPLFILAVMISLICGNRPFSGEPGPQPEEVILVQRGAGRTAVVLIVVGRG